MNIRGYINKVKMKSIYMLEIGFVMVAIQRTLINLSLSTVLYGSGSTKILDYFDRYYYNNMNEGKNE